MNTSDSPTPDVIEGEASPAMKRGRVLRWGMVLIALVGVVGAGWFLRDAWREERIRKFVSEYRRRGGAVTFTQVPFVPDLALFDLFPSSILNVRNWVRSINLWFDRERVSAISGAPLLSSDLGVISEIGDINAMTLPRTGLSSELIACVAGLPHLKKLHLPDSGGTDEALAELCRRLEGRPELSSLQLGRSQITENGIKELRLLRHLRDAAVESPQVKNSYKSFLATRKGSSRAPLR